MATRDCGYCEKLLCGGTISSPSTFFTLSTNLLCEFLGANVGCGPSPNESLNYTTIGASVDDDPSILTVIASDIGAASNVQFIAAFDSLFSPIDEALGAFGRGGFATGTPDLGADFPGKDYIVQVFKFLVKIPAAPCEVITWNLKGTILNCGPDEISSSPSMPSAAFIYVMDEDYFIFSGQGIPDPIPVGEVVPFDFNTVIASGGGVYIVAIGFVTTSMNAAGYKTAAYSFAFETSPIGLFTPETCHLPFSPKVQVCNQPPDFWPLYAEPLVLCDDDGLFVRHYQYDSSSGNLVGFLNTDLYLNPHDISGVAGFCS